jgi:hypothetical protein
MSMPWTFADLKRNAFGVILLITLFAVMVPSALNKWANDASPIRSVDVIDAMIKSGQGEGQNIMYLLFLENGSSVLIYDDHPRLIGSNVRLERVTRDNRSISYRFAN